MFIVLAVLAQIVRQLFGLVEWISLIASSSISFDWVNCLETFNLIILPFLFFHFKAVCEFGQLFKNYIWSTHSFLFILLQDVRELGQLYEYISSDHPIRSRSSVSRTCVNLINCFEISHLIILSSTFVSWSYWTWLIILRSHLLIRLREVRELGQWIYDLSSDDLSSDLPISSSSTVSRMYVNLGQLF